MLRRFLTFIKALQIAQLNRKAVRFYLRGDYYQAIVIANQSKNLALQHLNPSHPLLVTSPNQLARIYEASGNDSEAEPLYQLVLQIRHQTLGENHLSYATTFIT